MPRTAALATSTPTPAPQDQLSDALFRVAIEDATVGVVLIDMRGRIRFVNWAAAHMVGYSVAELTGKPLVRVLRQASESQIDTLFGTCPELDQHYPRWHAKALTARAKDGRPVPVEVSAAKMGLTDDPLLVVFVRDNLRHRRIEDELRKTQRRLEMLNEIMHFAAHRRECAPIWQKACDTLTGAFGWSMVGCLLPSGEGELFWGPTAGGPAAGTALDPANLVVRRVASERRSAYLPALEAEPDYVPVTSGAQSAILVPVQHRNAILGLLACESRQGGAFADHVIFLESLAEQMAAPLTAALEEEEALRRSRALETISEVSRIALETAELDEVLERIVGYVQHRFDLPFVYVALADENNEQLQLRSLAAKTILNANIGESFPVAGGSVIGRAFRTGEPQLVPDVFQDPDYLEGSPLVRAELAIPIRLHEEILGVLNLESSDAADFSTESCRILCLLADQVAGAVLLARTNRSLQQTTEQLAAANAGLQEASARLEEQSLTDPLTGLAEPQRFDAQLAEEWQRAQRSSALLSVALLELDGFKEPNDEQGHPADDSYLQWVAGFLQSHVQRAGDLVARYGGDEFALLLPGLTTAGAAERMEAIRSGLASLDGRGDDARRIAQPRLSVGVATAMPSRLSSPTALLRAADEALYQAKRAGGNLVVTAQPTPAGPPALQATG